MIPYEYPDDRVFMEIIDRPENRCDVMVDNKVLWINSIAYSVFRWDADFRRLKAKGLTRFVIMRGVLTYTFLEYNGENVQDNELRGEN